MLESGVSKRDDSLGTTLIGAKSCYEKTEPPNFVCVCVFPGLIVFYLNV
jgi:hypothetical protein